MGKNHIALCLTNDTTMFSIISQRAKIVNSTMGMDLNRTNQRFNYVSS